MQVLDHFEQGSAEWYAQRCGKVTMSRAKELITGGQGRTRKSYVMELVAETLGGYTDDGYQSIDMERGSYMEPWAVQAFEAQTGLKTELVGFVEIEGNIGCSPDRLIGLNEGLEVKAPRLKRHVLNLYGHGMIDYHPQVQGCLWVTGRQTWYLVSFCPDFPFCPFHMEIIERDEDMIERIARGAYQVSDAVTDLVRKATQVDIPDKVSEISMRARESWENVFSDDLKGVTDV